MNCFNLADDDVMGRDIVDFDEAAIEDDGGIGQDGSAGCERVPCAC